MHPWPQTMASVLILNSWRHVALTSEKRRTYIYGKQMWNCCMLHLQIVFVFLVCCICKLHSNDMAVNPSCVQQPSKWLRHKLDLPLCFAQRGFIFVHTFWWVLWKIQDEPQELFYQSLAFVHQMRCLTHIRTVPFPRGWTACSAKLTNLNYAELAPRTSIAWTDDYKY